MKFPLEGEWREIMRGTEFRFTRVLAAFFAVLALSLGAGFQAVADEGDEIEDGAEAGLETHRERPTTV